MYTNYTLGYIANPIGPIAIRYSTPVSTSVYSTMSTLYPSSSTTCGWYVVSVSSDSTSAVGIIVGILRPINIPTTKPTRRHINNFIPQSFDVICGWCCLFLIKVDFTFEIMFRRQCVKWDSLFHALLVLLCYIINVAIGTYPRSARSYSSLL